MDKILVSQCLLGAKVTYDGDDNLCLDPILLEWQKEGRLVAVCPEVMGGLSTPRPKAEISGNGAGKGVLEGIATVLTINAENVTQSFLEGAKKSLGLAQKHNIKMAILKQRSPSCGSRQIYDGSFSKAKIEGKGVTAALLEQNGIKVFGEDQLEEALAYFESAKS